MCWPTSIWDTPLEMKVSGFFLFKNSSFALNFLHKWPDKSTTSYDMLDIKSNLRNKYLVIERHMLHIQGILLQY